MPEMFEDFLKSDALIPLDKSFNEDETDLIFIHAHDALIEKRLGEDEAILVNKETLVAFTEAVKFEDRGKIMYRVVGPGMLWLETSVEKRTGFVDDMF
jgi:hypothetical protein